MGKDVDEWNVQEGSKPVQQRKRKRRPAELHPIKVAADAVMFEGAARSRQLKSGKGLTLNLGAGLKRVREGALSVSQVATSIAVASSADKAVQRQMLHLTGQRLVRDNGGAAQEGSYPGLDKDKILDGLFATVEKTITT